AGHDEIADTQAGAAQGVDLAVRSTIEGAAVTTRAGDRLGLFLMAEAIVDFHAADPAAVLPVVAAAEAKHTALWLRGMEPLYGEVEDGNVIRRDAAPAIAAEPEDVEAGPV